MSSCGCGCGCCGSTSLPCGCCEGTHAITPESEFNRPGLSAIHYRAGTHATFLETMEARLASDRRLDGLSTRDSSDASIAMLNAWATVGDVLTFYQERIANEGYLATATESRSVMELGNLIGYRPRPGISASVFLAYTLDKDSKTTIPAGSLVRSTPAPGESQQSFETSEALYAETAWNNLQVRLTKPATKYAVLRDRAVYLRGLVTTVKNDDPLMIEFSPGVDLLCRAISVDQDAAANRTRIGLEQWDSPGSFPPEDFDAALADVLRNLLRLEESGVSAANPTVKAIVAKVKPLVAALDAGQSPHIHGTLESIKSPAKAGKLKDWIDQIRNAEESAKGGVANGPSVTTVDQIATGGGLLTPVSLSPASAYNRPDDIRTSFNAPAAGLTKSTVNKAPNLPEISGAALRTLGEFRPAFRASLATALLNAALNEDPPVKVYTVLRANAFGSNAPPKSTTTKTSTPNNAGAVSDSFSVSSGEWDLATEDVAKASSQNPNLDKIDLDKEYDKVSADTLVAIQQGSSSVRYIRGPGVSTVSRADYALSGKVTRLSQKDILVDTKTQNLGFLRPVKLFLSDALLPLAEQPIPDPVCGTDNAIELDALYEGLTAGKWIILEGERADTTGTSGVFATELLLIGNVQHKAPDLNGDRMHTFLTPVNPSSYCYKRATLAIYGNVVKATHGETRKEVLGSGDATVPFLSFALKQPPLTFLPAPTASGAASTLKVYVNDVECHEVDSPVGLHPYDRRFFTQTADDGTTTVIFGNGVNGARVPTGSANLRAAYRYQIGKAGNVAAEQLNVLGSKPQGVKAVLNPMRASGGADKDPRDRMRENAPLTVTALDRLVSVTDYAHFSQTFAGIGKASSVALTDGHRSLVHVTIAGIDDIPIDASSDLYLNLRSALHRLGDPNLPIQLDVRAAKFLVFQAGVKVDPDYPWETMVPKMAAALLDAFSFERRHLGQNAYLSEVLAVLQNVPGVKYIDPTAFGSIGESDLTPSRIRSAISKLKVKNAVHAHLAESGTGGITPAEIAYFTPGVAATIALNQL